jgi:hypothetical protein
MADVLANVPQSLVTAEMFRPIKKQQFLASDASSTLGWGGIWFSHDGKTLDSISRRWTEEELLWPIYHMEVVASLRTAKWYLSLDEVKKRKLFTVRMAQDNQAAKVAVDRRFSSRVDTCELLDAFFQSPLAVPFRCYTTWCPSSIMAADSISRMQPVDEERVRQCAALLRQNPPIQDVLVRLRQAQPAKRARA